MSRLGLALADDMYGVVGPGLAPKRLELIPAWLVWMGKSSWNDRRHHGRFDLCDSMIR